VPLDVCVGRREPDVRGHPAPSLPEPDVPLVRDVALEVDQPGDEPLARVEAQEGEARGRRRLVQDPHAALGMARRHPEVIGLRVSQGYRLHGFLGPLHLGVGEQLPAPRDVSVAEGQADDRDDEEDSGHDVHAARAAPRVIRTGSSPFLHHQHASSLPGLGLSDARARDRGMTRGRASLQRHHSTLSLSPLREFIT
jgi:hypothetical protein